MGDSYRIEDRSREVQDMTLDIRPVAVKRLPESLTVQDKIEFRREIESVMTGNRPQVVIEWSSTEDCDQPVIDLLLDCLEEAMKRNGDVKLAAVPPAAAAVLETTGVAGLFEMFETAAEAVNSFYRIPQIVCEPDRAVREESDNAA